MTTESIELIDEMRSSIRQAVQRHDTLGIARQATEDRRTPSQWDLCVGLDLSGALISEAHGGLGLGPAEAIAALDELARALVASPLAGHLSASRLLDLANWDGIGDLASGARRATFSAARPPLGSVGWVSGSAGEWAPLPSATAHGSAWHLNGQLRWVVDLPGADVLVLLATAGTEVAAFVLNVNQPGVEVQPLTRYDYTTGLGHADLQNASAVRLDVPEAELHSAWSLAQAFAGAEALGLSRACLDMAVAHAKQRYAFSRPIGSYQAIKHRLVEILRLAENTDNTLYWFTTQWAENQRDSVALAGATARLAGDKAQQWAASSNIFVHGGMGATWEHDAPYFYRRAHLRRTLWGGTDNAAIEVGSHLLAAARKEKSRG